MVLIGYSLWWKLVTCPSEKSRGDFRLVQNSKLRSLLRQERSQGKLVERNLLSNKSSIFSKFPFIFQGLET